MCALSVPVERHCCTKCGCDRLPTYVATYSDSGTVTRATSARIHDTQNIMASTPMMVSSELISCPIDCCSVCPMLSMSLVARDSTSPRCRLSKYDSGSRDSFVCTSSRIRYIVRFTTRFTSRVATAISSPATANTASANSSTFPTAVKSMPSPGVKSVERSMSAMSPSPRSRIAWSTCSLVAPGSISRPTIPAKTRSVASPRIFGPATDRPTLITTQSRSA
ncbi:hypothetical protein SGLAM104S_03204 [Streptomyces glaucescens]